MSILEEMVEQTISYFTNLFERPKTSSFFMAQYEVAEENGTEIVKNQKVPKLYFEKFTLTNFKGVKKMSLNFVKDDLVLLLGLNESGKTTILKGIEAFDFRNDPDRENHPKYFTSIRNKSDVDFDGQCILSADVILESKLPTSYIKTQLEKDSSISYDTLLDLKSFIETINEGKRLTISRVFNFSNGEPTNYFYRFETDHEFGQNEFSYHVASEIIKICPPIIYFEDFKDRIPEKIYINRDSDSYDPVWYDIIDGLFYNTKSSYTVKKFKVFYENDGARVDDAKTVLKQVNKELNKVFTRRWKSLSGVKQIADTILEYNPEKQFFQLKIYDNDGTNFTVDERSKGALWYLSFLMKTEFRSKKMRKNSGKPVYLIDEPASNLHSTAQMNMVKNFHRLVKDTSIIYTTHSQYLVSLKSIRNTYIIQHGQTGGVNVTKWCDYIKTDVPDVKYYQPLADLLNIIPNNFDIPWHQAVITEGPSDMHVLKFMYLVIKGKVPDFAIYPGTSATKLETLISLNIGWNADFKVLLDSDDAGKENAIRYQEAFNLDKEIVLLQKDNKTIEKYFSSNDIESLYKIAFESEKESRISKKEFASMFALLNEKDDVLSRAKGVISDKTKTLFRELFELLDVSENDA